MYALAVGAARRALQRPRPDEHVAAAALAQGLRRVHSGPARGEGGVRPLHSDTHTVSLSLSLSLTAPLPWGPQHNALAALQSRRPAVGD